VFDQKEQKRIAYRAAVEFPVLYSIVGRTGWREASASDLSAGGLRLMVDEDVPVGSLIDLRFTLPNELVRGVYTEKVIEERTITGRTHTRHKRIPPAPFVAMRLRARVVVASLNVRREQFAHGVQFAEIDASTREEVQRFIHMWQLRQLRARAGQ